MHGELTINIRVFYFAIFNLLMFVTVSSFGQTFLNGVGLSLIMSIIYLFIFLKNLKHIPNKVFLLFLTLSIYCFVVTLLGKEDFKHYWVSVLTLCSIGVFVGVDFKTKNINTGMFLLGLSSALVLFLYNRKTFLANWNPNSISGLVSFGVIGVIFYMFNERDAVKKFFSLLVIICILINLMLTDSRNSILIFIIVVLTMMFYRIIFKSKLLFRMYYLISLFIPAIVAQTTDFINNSPWAYNLVRLSKEYFGKKTLMSERDIFWLECRRLIGDNWIFGTGESLYNYIYSHNLYYSVVYFFGVVGYVLYVMLLVSIMEYVRDNCEGDKVAQMCLLMFLGLFYGQIAECRLFTSNISMALPYIYLSVAINRVHSIKKYGMDMVESKEGPKCVD